MSRIHEDSPTAILPQFALWDMPGTQEMVNEDRAHIIRPISTYSVSTPIRFEIRPPIDEYTLLNESDLAVKLKVTISHKTEKYEANTNTTPHWGKITPVKNLLHSMFRYVSVSMNGKQINLSPSVYAYRAYMETLLGYSKDAKTGYLDSIPWKDSSLLVRGITSSDKRDSVIDLEGQLHLDLAFQEKAILGGTPLTIELIPQPPEFYFKCEDNYKVNVEILDIYFRCMRLQAVPAVVEAHNETLQRAMARYAFTRTELRHRTIPANVNDYTLDNIFSGILPRRLFIAFVSNNAFNGVGRENPFEFKPFNVSFLATYLNGKQVPSQAFTPCFDTHLYAREFRALYKALNQTGTDSFYCDNRGEWAKSPIYGINYAADLSNGGSFSSHVNTRKTGQLSIHVKFKTQNTDPIVAIFFSETDSCLEIDTVRNVFVDY